VATGSDENGFSFAGDGTDQENAGSEAAGLSTAGAEEAGDAAALGEEPVVTGDQKGLAGVSEAPAPVNEGLVNTGPVAAAGAAGVAPSRGGKVTTESLSGVISAAKSSGQI
jgi:hypothetical protein